MVLSETLHTTNIFTEVCAASVPPSESSDGNLGAMLGDTK